MVSIVVHADVQIHNVPIHQLTHVRNPVANDFIHRGAERLGELMVVERRGVGVSLHSGFMHHSVDFFASRPDLHCGGSSVQHLSANHTGRTNALNFLGSVHANGSIGALVLHFAEGQTLRVISVVWVLDALGHGTSGGLGGGAEGASEVVSLEFSRYQGGVAFGLLAGEFDDLVEGFVGGPVVLEAFLTGG